MSFGDRRKTHDVVRLRWLGIFPCTVLLTCSRESVMPALLFTHTNTTRRELIHRAHSPVQRRCDVLRRIFDSERFVQTAQRAHSEGFVSSAIRADRAGCQ